MSICSQSAPNFSIFSHSDWRLAKSHDRMLGAMIAFNRGDIGIGDDCCSNILKKLNAHLCIAIIKYG